MVDVRTFMAVCAIIGASVPDIDYPGDDYVYVSEYTCYEEDVMPADTVSEKRVSVTVYNAEPSQCWGDCTITASNKKIDIEKLNRGELRWCAVSRDLAKEYPFGSVIYLDLGYGNPMNGYWQVEDVMNKRFTNKVDLLVPSNLRVGKWDGKILDL